MRLSKMNVLRQCFDCGDYRYEGYMEAIEHQFFCEQCQKERMKDYEGGEEWTATWERV